MSIRESLAARWQSWKKPLGGLVVGLIVGPFVTSLLGWQVTTGTLNDEVQRAVIQQQSEMCEFLARQNVEAPWELGYQDRRDVAEKYAEFPWDRSVNYAVVSRCNEALAEEQPAGQPTAEAAEGQA